MAAPLLSRESKPRPRYRFSDFLVSTARRQLLQGGSDVPLIPRYFDLLVLLIERRHEALHRRDIFDGGAAAGLGCAFGSPRPGEGGMASPRGPQRFRGAVVPGLTRRPR